MLTLNGKKGLITGIANADSIAYAVAKSCVASGAEVALTYQNDKTRKYTEALAQELKAELFLPCDVTVEGSLDAVFEAMKDKWGTIDFVLHSMAFATQADLHGRVVDSSKEGLFLAIDISCHSFVRMAKLAEPLMPKGGSLVTMSYLGADRVVPNYGVMGLVKASLESATRYMASELGEKGIRVNCVSPGPVLTRAGTGITNFDQLMDDARNKSPMHSLANKEDIGDLTALLFSDAGRSMTGSLIYVDAGYHIMA